MRFARDLLTCTLRFIATLPLEVASFVVVPVACRFVAPGSDGLNRLPGWARWWDEAMYGTDGDPYWAGADHANGHQAEYLWRVRWLLRNRLNTFSQTVTGFRAEKIAALWHEGDIATSNRPGHSGYLYIEATLQDGTRRFEHYYVKQWGSSGRCLRFRFGWKLKDYILPGPDRPAVQFVFAPNPLMGFEICQS